MKKIRMFLVIVMVATGSLMAHGCRMWFPPAPPGLPSIPVPVPGR